MRSLVCRRCGPSAFGPAPSPAPRPPDRRPRPSLLRKAQKCTFRRERRTGRACALLRLERRCPDPRPTGSRRSLRCRSRWHPTPNSSLCCMGTASVHPDVCRRLYLAQLVPGRSRALRRRVPAAARHLGLSDERGGRRSLRRRARDGPAGRRGTGRAGRDAARTPPLQGAGPPPPGQFHHQGEDPGLSRVGLEPKRRCAALRRRGGELGSPGWSHLQGDSKNMSPLVFKSNNSRPMSRRTLPDTAFERADNFLSSECIHTRFPFQIASSQAANQKSSGFCVFRFQTYFDQREHFVLSSLYRNIAFI